MGAEVEELALIRPELLDQSELFALEAVFAPRGFQNLLSSTSLQVQEAKF